MSDQKVDDIQDDDLYDDYDDSSLDAEWDEFEDDTADAADAPADEQPAKKKRSFSTVLIIGLVVLLGLGFAVYQFGSSSPQPASSSSEDSVPVVASGVPAMEPSSTAALSQDGEVGSEQSDVAAGPLTPMPDDPEIMAANNQASLDPVSPDLSRQDVPPLMTAIPEADQTAESHDSGFDGMPLSTGVNDNPAPLMDGTGIEEVRSTTSFPSVDMIKKSDGSESGAPVSGLIPQDVVRVVPDKEDVSVESVPAETEMPINAQVNTDGETEAAASALRQIDSLKDSLEQSQKAAVDYKAQIDDLKSEVARLEATLAEQKDQNSPVASEKVSSKPVTPVSRTASPVVAPVSDVSSVSSVKWTLRGAKSGQALLARADSGQQDLRTVVVGDVVPGLGRIVAINQSHDGWIVSGTLGQVSE